MAETGKRIPIGSKKEDEIESLKQGARMLGATDEEAEDIANRVEQRAGLISVNGIVPEYPTPTYHPSEHDQSPDEDSNQ